MAMPPAPSSYAHERNIIQIEKYRDKNGNFDRVFDSLGFLHPIRAKNLCKLGTAPKNPSEILPKKKGRDAFGNVFGNPFRYKGSSGKLSKNFFKTLHICLLFFFGYSLKISLEILPEVLLVVILNNILEDAWKNLPGLSLEISFMVPSKIHHDFINMTYDSSRNFQERNSLKCFRHFTLISFSECPQAIPSDFSKIISQIFSGYLFRNSSTGSFRSFWRDSPMLFSVFVLEMLPWSS